METNMTGGGTMAARHEALHIFQKPWFQRSPVARSV